MKRNDYQKILDLYLGLTKDSLDKALEVHEQIPSEEDLLFFRTNQLVDCDCIGIQQRLVFLPRPSSLMPPRV